MHPASQLNRVASHMGLELNRRINRHRHEADYYALGEREQHFQFPLSGTLGNLPIEAPIDIKFDITFLYEYGYRRDSQLLEPLFRHGFTILSAPAGTVPYARVDKWQQDEDLNYTGATVVAGLYNPLILIQGAAVVNSTNYKATFHCSFHGYGYPIDPDMGIN